MHVDGKLVLIGLGVFYQPCKFGKSTMLVEEKNVSVVLLLVLLELLGHPVYSTDLLGEILAVKMAGKLSIHENYKFPRAQTDVRGTKFRKHFHFERQIHLAYTTDTINTRILAQTLTPTYRLKRALIFLGPAMR